MSGNVLRDAALSAVNDRDATMAGRKIIRVISFGFAAFFALTVRAEVQELTGTDIGPELNEFAPPTQPPQPPQPTMFGYAVAINGNFAFASMPAQGGGSGRVAIFSREDSGDWQRSGTLLPPAGETSFGASVAYQHGVAIVVAASGAYVYRHHHDNWVFTKKLAAPPGVAFGSLTYDAQAVAIAAAPLGKPATVYVYEGENFKGPTIVSADDVASADAFGFEIALAGHTLAVGAPFQQNGRGAVYVFQHNKEGWDLKQKLSPTSSDADLNFGASVGIDAKRIVVGAPGVPNPNTPAGHQFANRGAAYVFTRDGGAWVQQQVLQPTDEPGEYLNFGTQVRMRGDKLAVTSPLGSARFEPATCLLYALGGDQWVPQWYVLGEYTTGLSLALSRRAVILGGPIDSGGGYDIGHGLIIDLPQDSP